ncbi:N-formylglutamate amidohydrolase [Roseobacter litoralis]|uniref:N-formylglutamate amidohydrolase n=1 Tax=Roseobacter litoralis (strain ATCC 49566 / DSM 6996 / JCM 21268 / NBRC 15278 / OCh 149) TaxID=391595 RepID=F7ZDA4_ROSLO|nr:N-formylglutamate amidohydrolase [Roseobacter litoralis]AEI93313.1 putative N-formylglutamate amidohydrolase [Roseobacter litoralis Och 149]
MNQTQQMNNDAVVEVLNASGASDIVLVCEHASAFIPTALNDLGLSAEARHSHAAWDPGAKAVACEMARQLDAPLVASKVSRLVYDCNRPPDAPSAMPERSEVFDIPGNKKLTRNDRETRVARYYTPFHDRLKQVLSTKPDPVVVTIHSFTPIYQGIQREVEVGILYDQDTRLADAMLEVETGTFVTRRNDPYGPADGVTHTLKEHALPQGRRNVMIEIRNDLIETADAQTSLAIQMSRWVADAVTQSKDISCRV